MGAEKRIKDLPPVGDDELILTPRQVASLTRRHEATVTRALRDGELRGSQRVEGGRWFVRREHAVDWALGEAA